MSDRILAHVRASRDDGPCHPSVPVTLRDAMSIDTRLDFNDTARGLRIDEPAEIAAARATLPDTPVTDHFKEQQ